MDDPPAGARVRRCPREPYASTESDDRVRPNRATPLASWRCHGTARRARAGSLALRATPPDTTPTPLSRTVRPTTYRTPGRGTRGSARCRSLALGGRGRGRAAVG